MSTGSDRPIAERVRGFLQWFESLDAAEQEVLMTLYKEKKVGCRDVFGFDGSRPTPRGVSTFGASSRRSSYAPPDPSYPLRLRSNGRSGRPPLSCFCVQLLLYVERL